MDRIGRYTIEGELGRGGCGIVYLGRDRIMNRPVAIKTILTRELQSSSGGRELQARLAKEAQSAGSLNHPGIVTVYELAEENEMTYFVMECVDGPPLHEVMDKGPIAWQNVVQILYSIAGGLDFAHSKGIVHRDVKPANILISSSGHAKITDFGVAKLLETAAMTTTGMAVGTPAYMSPEQILTKPLDGRADQFSLAVIAFEMLTGRKPFQSDSLPGLIHQILSVEPPSATEINKAISEPAASVLRRALSKDPTSRFGKCREFVHSLEAALLRGEGTVLAPVARTGQAINNKPFTQSQTNSGVIGGLVIGLVLTIGVVIFAYSRRPPKVVATLPPAAVQTPPPSKPEPKYEPKAEVRKPDPPKPERPKPEREKKRPDPVPPSAPAATTPPPPVQPPDPGPDQPAANYMGSPEGRFSWSGTLLNGERLVIVRNRVRIGSIAGNGLPGGVPVQVDVRPADIQVMQHPSAANGFRLVVANQSGRDVSAFTVVWREQPH